MASSLVFLSFVFLTISASSATAFNITRLLDDHSDFSTFNSLLTQTHLASEINSRRTVTVLAIDNGAVSSLSGSSADVQKHVLSVHVILDYYDLKKLKAGNKSRLVTTLFQSSGLASNQMGFLNITFDKSSGNIMVGSASPGSSLSSTVVGEVVLRPYDVSVLRVTSLIQPPGIENVNASSKAKAPAKSPSKTPAKSPSKSPAESPSKSPSSANSPSKLPANTPSKSPAKPKDANGPSPDADTPPADTPADARPSPGNSDDDRDPLADGPGSPAAGPAVDDSAAARVAFGGFLGGVVGVVCSSIMALS